MNIKYTTINGKQVKLYPAFRTESHAHDIEFRRNRVMNELDDKRDSLSSEQYGRMEQLVDDLTEILGYISFPVTFLPYNLYQVARETINWAAEARS